MNPDRAPVLTLRLKIFRWLLLIIASLVTFGALILPDLINPSLLPLQVGDVSPRDFEALRDITFESEVLTEQRRQAAADAVLPVYNPPDPAISRQQMVRLRQTLDAISRLREDDELSPDQKQTQLTSLPDLSLSEETVSLLLELSDERWNVLRTEAISVLERTLRGVIRESDVETVRRAVPSLVSLSLSESEAELVAKLVQPFVIANSLYSPELTEAARRAARESVEPVNRTYKAGQIVLRAGEVITEAHLEALTMLGLIRVSPRPLALISAGALTALAMAFLVLYFYRRWQLEFLYEPRSLLVVTFSYMLFLVAARVVIPDNVLLPYLYPMPALGMLLVSLFGLESGLVFSIITAFLVSYGFRSDLLPYYLLTSLSGVLALGSARHLWSYLWAGVAVTGSGAAILLAFRFVVGNLDWLGMLQLLLATAGCGFLSAALALLGQYLLAQWLGFVTPLQLLEISRPDFPLMQFFLRNAPGTYQHSLQVANLAEQAAEAIGADPLLTRVGALFHDIGKANNPAFFIENQAPGQVNTHQDMDPEQAAAIIIRHVRDGLALARKYRLPRRIEDFILEHHGTLLTRYQYNQALQQAGGDPSKVDVEKFRYPGPRPRSRETAILMLADGAEARARANNPRHEDEIRALVQDVIEQAHKDGQLDQTNLTLHDLHLITESFVNTLRGTYHPRIHYPAAEPPVETEPLPTTPQPK